MPTVLFRLSRRRRGASPSRGFLAALAQLPAATVLAALSLAAVGAPGASAQTFDVPPDFEVVPLPGNYNIPVGIVFAPDGHVFLLEKPGPVRVLDQLGNAQATPFIDLTSEVNNDHDRGLLGLALHPGFVADGGDTSWVYLLYTVSPIPPADNSFNGSNKYSFSRLTRYKAVTNAGVITADLATRQILIGNQLADGSVPDCIASMHNSHSNGAMHFADDGSLMLATGDGAHYDFQDNGGSDNAGFDDVTTAGKKGPTPKIQDEGSFRAQDLRSLAGKVLRINPASGQGYASNPFYDGDPASNRSKVWALGLRNPFRMEMVPGTGAADPALGQPNVLILGDVGWNTWEESNVSRIGGENFGWPCYEGFLQQSGYQGYTSGNPNKVTCHTPVAGTLTLPKLAWHHSTAGSLTPSGLHLLANGNPGPGFPGNCSIGGALYTGGTYPAEYIGRAFVADYGQSWVKTLSFDANWNVVAVQDFGSDMGAPVDLERNPITGDIWMIELAESRILQIRYGGNLTPTAVASADPTQGSPPLLVSFSGAGSSDPEGQSLAFDWDFGDGSAHSSAANPQHTYTAAGLYDATLTVTDPPGLFGQDVVQIAVGNVPPTATILAPTMNMTYHPPVTIDLSGQGIDPEGGPLAYEWQIDLHHADHVHPGTFLLPGAQSSFDITESVEDDELLYYAVRLTVTDSGGLTGSDHVFIYPEAAVRDVSGPAIPVSLVQSFVPPFPTGGGSIDIEVIRDHVLAPVGSDDDSAQYDTVHNGDQGSDDWIGYELASPPTDAFRFIGLDFQEGKHFWDGGWFKDLSVEVRSGGTWTPVTNLRIAPDYPFGQADDPFFDGINFQRYAIEFDAAKGDGVRMRGTPGGSEHFISCGELAAFAVDATPFTGQADISSQGTIIAALFSLFPPQPLGLGSQDPETIRNGVLPPQGSPSFLAQFDTFHDGDQGALDWIGYDFGETRTFLQVRFQEGRNNVDGGAFDDLHLQVQDTPGGPWTDVPGLVVSPPYPGLNGVHYETFTLDFPAVTGRALRLAGTPSGSAHFISVGELTVYGPALPASCGFTPYGEGAGGANTLALASTTPPGLGLPILIRASGAVGPASGLLGVALTSASLPVKGGTLLLEPVGILLLPIAFDDGGFANLAAVLPTDPSFDGLSIDLQAFAFGQPAPAVRFSNGLEMRMCAAGP